MIISITLSTKSGSSSWRSIRCHRKKTCSIVPSTIERTNCGSMSLLNSPDSMPSLMTSSRMPAALRTMW